MDYLLTDLIGMIKTPKETFKSITNNSNKLFLATVIFLTGIIIAVKKVIAINKNFAASQGTGYDIVQMSAMRDGGLITAWFMPIGLLILWFIIAFFIDFIADKLGSLSGELSEIQIALGYICIFIFIFELLTLPLVLAMEYMKMSFLDPILTLFQIIFYGWLFYLGAVAVEATYQVPMSYGFIIFITVTALSFFLYHIIVDWIIGQIFITGWRKPHYAKTLF